MNCKTLGAVCTAADNCCEGKCQDGTTGTDVAGETPGTCLVCLRADAACGGADTCCDNRKCKDDAGAEVNGEAEKGAGKCKS